jgi:hypothetical protein
MEARNSQKVKGAKTAASVRIVAFFAVVLSIVSTSFHLQKFGVDDSNYSTSTSAVSSSQSLGLPVSSRNETQTLVTTVIDTEKNDTAKYTTKTDEIPSSPRLGAHANAHTNVLVSKAPNTTLTTRASTNNAQNIHHNITLQSTPPPTPSPSTPAFLYIMKFSGFGSQIMNLFAAAVYYEEHENRSIMVDEQTYMYRLNKTIGVLTGFFTPQFPVIDTAEQQRALVEPFFPDSFNYRQRRKAYDKAWKWKPNANDKPDAQLKVTGVKTTRSKIKANYNPNSVDFYLKLVQKMCPHMQFNAYALAEIAARQQDNGVLVHPSVAFHIRRGDKVTSKESKEYNGEVYVKKLLTVAPNVDFQTCFVASDSYDVVQELQSTLELHNITCRLVTLTEKTERGHDFYGGKVKGDTEDTEETLQFLSQLEIMTRATYFVGTFGSNVGAVASILRGCRSDLPQQNYSNSYGVDTDKWFFT